MTIFQWIIPALWLLFPSIGRFPRSARSEAWARARGGSKACCVAVLPCWRSPQFISQARVTRCVPRRRIRRTACSWARSARCSCCSASGWPSSPASISAGTGACRCPGKRSPSWSRAAPTPLSATRSTPASSLPCWARRSARVLSGRCRSFCSLPIFVYSARREEELLREQFPGQYPDYMRRTKMIVPFVL